MSLLTVHQINIFNFNLKILVFLLNKDYEEQERAVEIIDKMNKTNNYTYKNFTYETFIKEYSIMKIKDLNMIIIKQKVLQ